MDVIYILPSNIYTNKFKIKYKLKDNIRNKEISISAAVLCWTYVRILI
jgi:hypothetical protein